MDAVKYLLDIRPLLEPSRGEELLERALERVDAERRRKAEGIRPGRARAASLGAGLLLQLALGKTSNPPEPGGFEVWTVPELLGRISRPLPLEYRYGEGGKPYLKNDSRYFNLSHSGDYVFCAVSRDEIGADIQIHRTADGERLAGRFFSGEECEALERSDDKKAFFFRLWVRKEAYGKLTGEGLSRAVGRNLLPPAEDVRGELLWEEYEFPEGYSAAVCAYRRKEGDRSESV